MSSTELLKEALKLPAEEREEFANQLWDSLNESSDEEFDGVGLTAEIERRLAEMDSGAVTPVDAFDSLAEITRRFVEKHGR